MPVLPLLLGVAACLIFKSQGSAPGQVNPQYFAQVKAAIKTAVDQDVARGAPSTQVNDGWLNQLAMAWTRGDVTEINGIAGGLRMSFPLTAQAFGSRWQQITGRPWVPPAAAVATKAAA